MEIPLRSQFDSTHWAFVMALDTQDVVGIYDGVVSCLNMQVQFKRPLPDSNQPPDVYPVLLELHGKLYRTNQQQEHGAELQPVVDLPISCISPETWYFSHLSFRMPKRYLQLLEEYRAEQQTQMVQLQMRLWGIVALMKARPNISGTPNHLQARSGEVVRFEKVHTENNDPSIRIERSAWIDRILPGLGYRHSVLIELPLVRTPPVPEAYQKAAEALDMARRAFDQEDYRGALKHARDVLDFLAKSSQGKQLTSFCEEYIKPVVGETKSKAIDRSFNALRDIVNAGSHLDPHNPFHADRSTATYVIETLALNLRYISSVLG